MNILDTIAAVSTPFGMGGIAVIRISGEDALSIAQKVFEPLGHTELLPERAYYGRIISDGVQIDDGICVYFKAPRSFTGEDTVELSCHGGILITQRVLEAVLSAGARAATAGEFTRRAYINGKLRLSGAEALGSLLYAQTDEQITLARSGMRGTLSKKCDKIYDSLCNIVASVFAHIDYPDEDLADMSKDEMLAAVDRILLELESLCNTYKTGRAVAEGIPTVIAGRTNAGKSSLYNRLVGRDAAIVTSIAGTTRDVLTETAMLGRVLLRLSDTAGLRDTGDTVERIGVERAKEEICRAELILYVIDGSVKPTEDDVAITEYIKESGRTTVAVLNKSDMGICAEARALCASLDVCVEISADKNDGIDALCRAVEDLFIDNSLDTGADAILASSRQYAAAKQALDSLYVARENILCDSPLEICCSELECAMRSIGSLDGRVVSEDVVAKIFSSFCVGK